MKIKKAKLKTVLERYDTSKILRLEKSLCLDLTLKYFSSHLDVCKNCYINF